MTALRWDNRPEDLRSPVLLFAFTGWNDAGEAASGALAAIEDGLGAKQAGAIDPEDFYDFQVSRPTIDLSKEPGPALGWPEVRISVARPANSDSDLILVTGSEPSHRWRGFSDLIVDMARDLGVDRVVGLGALLADIAHTRDARLTAISSSPGIIEGMGFRSPTYSGPTGIVGVIHTAAGAAGFDTVSLWVPVPHYLGGAPNPKGALALVRALGRIAGVRMPLARLEEAVLRYEREVSEAVEHDPDAGALVERLERAADREEEQLDPGTIPSGDAIADEIQGFLRRRDSEAGGS